MSFMHFENLLKNSFFYFALVFLHPFECVFLCMCRPRFMESTGSRAVSHPAVVRTQKAAAVHPSRHTNPQTMKASPAHDDTWPKKAPYTYLRWTAFSFDCSEHSPCHCFNNLMQCQRFFPSTVEFVFLLRSWSL